ncbi:MAG: CocE/NonD family hydrolase [Actinomycetota bacterium]
MRTFRVSAYALALVAAVSLPASGAGAAPSRTAGPPQDYMKTKGLTEARYETERTSDTIEMKDGTKIYVEVVRPKKPGRYGVILELSPYHGTLADRSGTRILPGPKKDGEAIGLAGYFAPRGYAVVFADLRGTGRSEGCLDHLGPNDQSDAKEIVEWAAKQKWSNGRVGMTGHSYVGSTPQMAAAQKPKGLVTIVPSAGLAAMYHHEFQLGVPYFLQWAGPVFAYELLAMQRYFPEGTPAPLGGESGDNFGGNPQGAACGWQNSAIVTGEAYFSGAETDWHRERDFRKGVTKADIPIFLVHGVDDNAARIAGTDWFIARDGHKGDKAWIGQWDHGSDRYPNSRTCLQTASTPCEDDQWTSALHAWFDHHLLKRNVDTGPPVEVFLNNGTVLTATEWPVEGTDKLRLYAEAGGKLNDRPADEGEASYVADPRGASNEFNTGNVSYETAPMKRDTLIVGVPTMQLSVSVVGSTRIHILPSLYDVKGDEADRIGRAFCAIQPELRDGIDSPAPVIPAEVMEIKLTCMSQAHLVAKGHRLRLTIASSHPDKVPTFAEGSRITVYSGGREGTYVDLPVIYNPPIYKDFFVPAE